MGTLQCKYDPDGYCFVIKQDNHPEFIVNEGNMGILLDAFYYPQCRENYLFKTFLVTEKKGSVILTSSTKNQKEILLYLKIKDAELWVSKVRNKFNSVIEHYHKKPGVSVI